MLVRNVVDFEYLELKRPDRLYHDYMVQLVVKKLRGEAGDDSREECQ